MKAPGASDKWLDVCSEMICDGCMDAKPFLKDYTGLALQPVLEDAKEDKPEADDSQLKNELDRSICDIMKVPEGESQPDEGEPSQKRAKLDDCRRPKPTKEHQGE